jgi:hypothetical protein
MGVDRKARNIVFHGRRHFYAARMADIEAADNVRRITGHRSRAVFDAYADHMTEADVRDMGRAAAVFAGVLAGAAAAGTPGAGSGDIAPGEVCRVCISLGDCKLANFPEGGLRRRLCQNHSGSGGNMVKYRQEGWHGIH